MKRKDFIRSLIFGCAAALIPKALISNKATIASGIDWQPLSLIPPKLNESTIAKLKSQRLINKLPPTGKRIDDIQELKKMYNHYIKRGLNKINKYGLD